VMLDKGVRPLYPDFMRALLLIVLWSLLSGCDLIADKVSSVLFGVKDSAVVLSSTPQVLTETPIAFTSTVPMTVLGEWTSVCLVLRDSVPLDHQPKMDALFAEAMHDSRVTVVVHTSEGTQKTLMPPMIAWRKFGKILSRDELSGCASASCEARLPMGVVINKIEISARPNLEIKGVYWRSTPDLPKPPEQSRQEAASRGRTASSCN